MKPNQRASPGGYLPLRTRIGPFSLATRRLKPGALFLADRRVLRLHPKVAKAIARTKPLGLLSLPAGEGAKTFPALESVLRAGVNLHRSGTLVAIGGGTIGDLSTVAAHLLKRGVELIHVPTTLLAAVDSSVGGKGAVHLRAGHHAVKNAAGVFHDPSECWVCPELFKTLEQTQLREGAVEGWKMLACLDAASWRSYRRRAPTQARFVAHARALKDQVCRSDPYERTGRRAVLNFGHTFGHVLESLTRFRLSHGDAVAVGILCALDVGRALGVTRPKLAEEVEGLFSEELEAPGRAALAIALRSHSFAHLRGLLLTDKKAGQKGLQMVLLERLGRAVLHPVPEAIWEALLPAWREGVRP